LNSCYGAILNSGCRFFDKRIGQSTTLTGRSITRHMTAQVNDIVCGEYNYLGKSIIYNDTDSSFFTTKLRVNKNETITIEDAFNSCTEFWNDGDKEYGYNPELTVMSYDPIKDEPYQGHINYVYRHKVAKYLYEIEDDLGNTVVVTEDHSVMVEREGKLIELKPMDIQDSDVLISITTRVETD